MRRYKFKIHYILKKENERANALNKRCNYIKFKKIFNYNILKINKDEILFANYVEINIIMSIMNDKDEKFSMKKKIANIKK